MRVQWPWSRSGKPDAAPTEADILIKCARAYPHGAAVETAAADPEPEPERACDILFGWGDALRDEARMADAIASAELAETFDGLKTRVYTPQGQVVASQRWYACDGCDATAAEPEEFACVLENDAWDAFLCRACWERIGRQNGWISQ